MEEVSVYSSGKVEADGREYRCALGRSGVTDQKREGDGATPLGSFPIRRIFYRPDRLDPPRTTLPVVAMKPSHGWSDDSEKPGYNTLVELPYEGSHEKLWREDEIYDIVVELGYNDDPPVPGKGSAIFMHIARPAYTPTEGCIALSKENLLELLAKTEPGTLVRVER